MRLFFRTTDYVSCLEKKTGQVKNSISYIEKHIKYIPLSLRVNGKEGNKDTKNNEYTAQKIYLIE